MVSALDSSLTNNDARVLHALFDPESAPSSAIHIEPTPQTFPHISETDLPKLRSQESAAIRPLNVASPSQTALETALQALTDLISTNPDYASAYANRAQVLRLQLDLRNEPLFPASTSASQTHSDLLNRLFSDLSRAITLATPSSPAAPVSPAQAALLATTHTHRGYLLMKAATAANASEQKKLEVGPHEIIGLNADQLEELASKDFFLGGRYGDKDARQLAVKTNPYAKMCGAIVKEAIVKEITAAKGLRDEILGV